MWGWIDYATCSLSREIIQEAMPLILSNGKKRAKIFPTNIWKLREYKWFSVRSSNPKYIELLLRFHQNIPLQTQDININFLCYCKMKSLHHVHVWDDFMHFLRVIHSINFNYLFQSVDPFLLKSHWKIQLNFSVLSTNILKTIDMLNIWESNIQTNNF